MVESTLSDTSNGVACMAEDLVQPQGEIRPEQLAAGKATAPEELYGKYRRGLVLMLQRLVGDRATAEDLSQEACRILTARLQSTGLEDPRNAVAFLHATARNLAIAERRKRNRRRTDTAADTIDQFEDLRFDPSDVAEREQYAAVVRKLLDELSQPRDRMVLIRFYLDEADKREICAELDLSEQHFNRVLFRAKQRFREILRRGGITGLLFLVLGCISVVA
jgi:RNA polymerase sigma-70 factor (ECF subfamily)